MVISLLLLLGGWVPASVVVATQNWKGTLPSENGFPASKWETL